jgi:hypothetical protein
MGAVILLRSIVHYWNNTCCKARCDEYGEGLLFIGGDAGLASFVASFSQSLPRVADLLNVGGSLDPQGPKNPRDQQI